MQAEPGRHLLTHPTRRGIDAEHLDIRAGHEALLVEPVEEVAVVLVPQLRVGVSDTPMVALAGAVLANAPGTLPVVKDQKAVAANSYYWTNHTALGYAYMGLGDNAKALPEFEKVIEIAPGVLPGEVFEVMISTPSRRNSPGWLSVTATPAIDSLPGLVT